jgi:hypothetical protein
MLLQLLSPGSLTSRRSSLKPASTLRIRTKPRDEGEQGDSNKAAAADAHTQPHGSSTPKARAKSARFSPEPTTPGSIPPSPHSPAGSHNMHAHFFAPPWAEGPEAAPPSRAGSLRAPSPQLDDLPAAHHRHANSSVPSTPSRSHRRSGSNASAALLFYDSMGSVAGSPPHTPTRRDMAVVPSRLGSGAPLGTRRAASARAGSHLSLMHTVHTHSGRQVCH